VGGVARHPGFKKDMAAMVRIDFRISKPCLAEALGRLLNKEVKKLHVSIGVLN